jgi:hypothetical protein
MTKNKKATSVLILLMAATWLAGGQVTAPVPAPEKGGQAFRGYFNITDMGLLIGSIQNRHPAPFIFLTTNGFHLTEQLSLGLGTGVEFLSGSYLPILVDVRYYVRNSGFSPFFSLFGGGTIPLDDDGSNGTVYSYDAYWPYPDYKPYEAKGGWLLNPGFGIRNMFGKNFGIIFAAGYRFQRLYYASGDDRRLTVDYNRLSMKIGIIFR